MNDFDSILARLKEAMPKDISTIEGSFAGDILMAVANEMAKFYAIDLETLYERAFISTATGQWLDRACGDWGIERMENETDETFRTRALTALKNQSASGNIGDYKKWALETGLIQAVQVHPLSNGAGTVSVFVLLKLGAPENALEEIAAYIEEHKPVGAKLTVTHMANRALDITASIKSELDAITPEMTEDIKARISALFDRLTGSGEVPYISFGQVAAAIMEAQGVADAIVSTVSGNSSSFLLQPKEFPTLGYLTLSRRV